MDALQRKVELQAPADLTFIIDNIKEAAQKKLDKDLPLSTEQGAEDEFRTKVEALVQQYIHETLSLTIPSLSINGLDASPSILSPPTSTSSTSAPIDPNDPSYEPYDTALAEKLRGLHASLETETTRVAELRREAPAKAAKMYAERLREDLEKNERAVEEARVWAREEGARRGVLEGLVVERPEEVARTWDRSTKGLEALAGITEGVARLERAKRGLEEVERL